MSPRRLTFLNTTYYSFLLTNLSFNVFAQEIRAVVVNGEWAFVGSIPSPGWIIFDGGGGKEEGETSRPDDRPPIFGRGDAGVR